MTNAWFSTTHAGIPEQDLSSCGLTRWDFAHHAAHVCTLITRSPESTLWRAKRMSRMSVQTQAERSVSLPQLIGAACKPARIQSGKEIPTEEHTPKM